MKTLHARDLIQAAARERALEAMLEAEHNAILSQADQLDAQYEDDWYDELAQWDAEMSGPLERHCE